MASAKPGYIDSHSHVWTADIRRFPPRQGVSILSDEAGWTVESWTGDELLAAASPSGVDRVVLIGHGLIYGYDNSFMLHEFTEQPDKFRVVAQVRAHRSNASNIAPQ
eukprot:SAG31_NODE_812_length_11915_cov_64.697360_4_plen_107_part_00